MRPLNILDQTGVICDSAAEPVGHCQISATASVLERVRSRLLVVFPFQVVLTLAVLAVPFCIGRAGINDPDIWWHLRNAEYLVQHHHIPDRDMFSFTVGGHPWTNHEWLAELPYYFAWRVFGLVGLKSLSLVLIFLLLLGVLYLAYRESGNFKAAVAASCFAAFLSSVSFGPRTILFGYLYLIALLSVLQKFRREGRAPLWMLPPLFCLWVNTHGSWLLGFIIFSISAAAGLIEGHWGSIEAKRWTTGQMRKLGVAWGLSIAALFVNPIGPRLVTYPFDLAFRQKLNIAHVAEWVSVDFHTFRGKLVLVMLVVLLVSVLVRRSRWTLAELLVVLFAMYSGLTYIRFLVLLSIVIAPILAKALDFFTPYRPELETPITNMVVSIAIMVAMIHYWPANSDLQKSMDESYPAKALAYFETHPPAEPMLNFYLWGGYLEWNNRNMKVFLDSRVDIFEYEGVLQDYLHVLGLDNTDAVLEKYKIRSVLFPPEEPFTKMLQKDPRWKTTYADQTIVVLEKNSAASALSQ